MTNKTPPSPDVLRELMHYECITGKLFWRERDVSLFSDGTYSAERARNIWNGRYVGEEAFTAKTSDGYLHGSIFGQMHRTHRVIWAIHHGSWPDGEIDHINHDRTDNRIINLREVTSQENSRNQSIYASNTSGQTGVSWHKRDNKWVAHIFFDGKKRHLGLFTDISDAIAARAAAEIKHGFHKNHGSN